jgi:hypothetical protein
MKTINALCGENAELLSVMPKVVGTLCFKAAWSNWWPSFHIRLETSCNQDNEIACCIVTSYTSLLFSFL